MKPYRFLEEADAEFQRQISYYDEQAAGLGDRFISDLEATVRSIREYPESGEATSTNLRKRVLRVFRHSVFYVNLPTWATGSDPKNENFIVRDGPGFRRRTSLLIARQGLGRPCHMQVGIDVGHAAG